MLSFGQLELEGRLEEDFDRKLGKGWVMYKRLGISLIASALIAAPAAAQEDATGLLQAADQAMGASNLNSLHISGAGWYAPLGQNFSPEEHWARLNLQSYDLTIDYNAGATREELVVTQGDYPSRGGGFQPIVGERRTLSFVNGDDAWTLNAQGEAVPQQNQAEVRQFLISTSPHGFIKAALESDDATVVDRYLVGTDRTIKVVGFTTMGKYRITGELDEPEGDYDQPLHAEHEADLPRALQLHPGAPARAPGRRRRTHNALAIHQHSRCDRCVASRKSFSPQMGPETR